MRGISLTEKLKIDHGFGEDHPLNTAHERDNDEYWRASEILIFGKKPSLARPKRPKMVESNKFEIRLVSGISLSFVGQSDQYCFQIVDVRRRKTAFFLYNGLGVTLTPPVLGAPFSASNAGPPTSFTTSRPTELYQFNCKASLVQEAGASIGPLSKGGTLGLKFLDIRDARGQIFTDPRLISISGGPNSNMITIGLGSISSGVIAKITDDTVFYGY